MCLQTEIETEISEYQWVEKKKKNNIGNLL